MNQGLASPPSGNNNSNIVSQDPSIMEALRNSFAEIPDPSESLVNFDWDVGCDDDNEEGGNNHGQAANLEPLQATTNPLGVNFGQNNVNNSNNMMMSGNNGNSNNTPSHLQHAKYGTACTGKHSEQFLPVAATASLKQSQPKYGGICSIDEQPLGFVSKPDTSNSHSKLCWKFAAATTTTGRVYVVHEHILLFFPTAQTYELPATATRHDLHFFDATQPRSTISHAPKQAP